MALTTICETPDLNISVEAMTERRYEVPERPVALGGSGFDPVLAAIAANPRSRALFDVAMDRSVTADSNFLKKRLKESPRFTPEVIIGSGVHAAVYASTKVFAGGSPPLVIERRERPGGAFALARRAVFSLNSRNRPENLNERRRPGTPGPLNSEVGGLLQPSDISAQEYQTQADQAFVTRVNLIMNARLLVNTKITEIRRSNGEGRYMIFLSGLSRIFTNRIIIASGVGEPTIGFNVRGDCPGLMSFDEFVEEVGDPNNLFPLRGYRNVAVVGANDSGKVAIEYLLGQAGDQALSVASLDTVERINWIGQERVFKEEYEEANRSRYKGIGRFMPREGNSGYYFRVLPQPGKAILATPEGDGTRLRWRRPGGFEQSKVFDHVIVCTGFADQMDTLLEGLTLNEESVESGGKIVGRKLVDEQVYKVGPAAKLAVGDIERRDVPVFEKLPDNSVAVFRYSELTASLARSIGLFNSRSGEVDTLLKDRSMPSPSSTLTIPVSPPMILPETATSEDVLRFVSAEVFSVRNQRFGLRLMIRRSGNNYIVRPTKTVSLKTRAEINRFISDPAVQAVLARYFRQFREVAIGMVLEKRPRGVRIEGSN